MISNRVVVITVYSIHLILRCIVDSSGKHLWCCLCSLGSVYSSCTEEPQTPSNVHSAQRHSEDTPHCPISTFSASATDASLYMTPVAYQMTTDTVAEPVTPCLQSISTTPGFSAFKPLIKEPVYMQSETPTADSTMSPHKVSVVRTDVSFSFSISLLLTFLMLHDFEIMFFITLLFSVCIDFVFVCFVC